MLRRRVYDERAGSLFCVLVEDLGLERENGQINEDTSRGAVNTPRSGTLARVVEIHSLGKDSGKGGGDEGSGITVDKHGKEPEDHEQLVFQHVEPW